MLCRSIARVRDIDWKEGSGTVMYYIAVMWLIALAAVLFTDYFHTYSNVGHTQMYADIVADGSAFVANNGWGLNENVAKVAKKQLVKYNKDSFKDTTMSVSFSKTDNNGKTVQKDAGEKNPNNTVNAKAKVRTKTLYAKKTVSKTKKASTHITYSGGLRIVLEAWRHSYEYCQTHSDSYQTAYLWGGGHGSDDDSWKTYADCSGFVSGVYRECGYYIPSWACTWNMEEMGQLVAVGSGSSVFDKARPGDIVLVWWDGAGVSDHVQIYAGKKNGTHYVIHSRGGQANDITNVGLGASKGVHITTAPTYAPKVMIRRIVDTTATVAETPKVTIGGMTDDELVIYEALQLAGYSDKAIAALMGNFAGETNGTGPILPTASEANDVSGRGNDATLAEKIKSGKYTKVDFVYEGLGSTGHSGGWGYGIAQWTTVEWGNPFGDRKAQLWDWCENHGSNVTDVYMQISFVINELAPGGNRSGVGSYLRSTNDSVDNLTEYVMKNYEGINNQTSLQRDRQPAARKYLKWIQQGAKTVS